MAKYRKSNPAKWNDPRFRALPKPVPSSRYLYWFLRLGPQTGIVPGLYEARAGGLADYLGWDRDGFDQAFAELEQQDLARADWEAGLVWVPDAIEDDHPQSLNAAKSWGAALAELPDCQLKNEAYQYVLAFADGIREGLREGIREAIAEGFRKACPTQITDNRSQIPDTRSQKTDRAATAAPARPAEGSAGAGSKKSPAPKAKVDAARLKDARKAANTRPKGKAEKPPIDRSPSADDLFACDLERRDRLLAELDGRHGQARQRKTADLVREEVLRVFRAERERVTGDGYVRVGKNGAAAALEVGTACIGYRIRPEQLIEYWLDPENNFTNMTFPSLTFLGNDKNLDRAAATIGSGKAPRKRAAGRGHSYDDPSDLHPRLRATLVDAGVDVSEMSDRELLTVQNAAKALAAGGDPGMSRKLRAMADRARPLFEKGAK